jgi:TonB family protein
MNTRRILTHCSAVLAAALLCQMAAMAGPLLKIGTQESSTYHDAEVVYSPKPEISSELKEECLKTSCVAKFAVSDEGKTSVRLVSSSGSADVDETVMSTLRQWKFKPATVDGKPISSSRTLRIEFEII